LHLLGGFGEDARNLAENQIEYHQDTAERGRFLRSACQMKVKKVG
jgi:hypothetical protein